MAAMTSRPHPVCQTCEADQSKVWIGQFWLYCPHNKAMARRRKATDPWTVDRNVAPKKAEKHVTAALALMADYCEKQGTSLESSFALIQRVFEHDSKAKGEGR